MSYLKVQFVCLALLATPLPLLLSPPWQIEDEEFNPKTLINKPFPAIKNQTAYAKDDVQVDEDEMVLGIEINGKSRAYPINMLKGPRREIINDQLGGTDIAATW